MIYQGPKQIDSHAFTLGKNDCLQGKTQQIPAAFDLMEQGEYLMGWEYGEYVQSVIAAGPLD